MGKSESAGKIVMYVVIEVVAREFEDDHQLGVCPILFALNHPSGSNPSHYPPQTMFMKVDKVHTRA
jgi:hypothetical protein